MIEIKKRRDRPHDFFCVDIFLTRGDSAYIDFDLMDESDNPISLGSDDFVHCQVREGDGNLIFDSKMSGTTWHIRPEDTKTAELDEYTWDAQIEYSNGDVFTFVPLSKFVLLPESTKKDGD